MAAINQQNVFKELVSAEPIIKETAKQIVYKDYFVPAIRDLRRDFEEHVVTQEIDAGMNEGIGADNRSGTLIGSSFGNLFSFIGFEQGTHPTNAIRNRLTESSFAGPKMISLPVKKARFIYEFEIRGPDLEAIYEATPLPWAKGLSWAERIERGIEGLGRFVVKEGYGRSGGGYQSKHEVRRAGKSRPIEYLSGIARRFLQRFK